MVEMMSTKAPAAKPEADLVSMAQIRELKKFAASLETVTNVASLVNAISEHALANREILVKAKKAAVAEVEIKRPVAGAAKKPTPKAPKKTKPAGKKKPAKKASAATPELAAASA